MPYFGGDTFVSISRVLSRRINLGGKFSRRARKLKVTPIELIQNEHSKRALAVSNYM